MLSNNETTARLIAEGLKNLLKTKDLDRIRIKEITDEVGLMRPTFYNYFQDKYEVVEYIFTHEVLEPMRPFLQSGLIKEAFHFMIVAIQKDSAFYRREIMRSSPEFLPGYPGSKHARFSSPHHPGKDRRTEASVSDCGKHHRILHQQLSLCTYQMAGRITGNSRGSDHGSL